MANAQSILATDLYVNGQLSAKSFTPPAGSITDASIAAAAGIQATKVQREYAQRYVQASGTTAFAETRAVHAVFGATGTLISFQAGSVTICSGNATITLSLKKNGTTVANTTITLNSNSAAYGTATPGGFVAVATVSGDIWELAIAVAAGTGVLGLGVYGVLGFREDPF